MNVQTPEMLEALQLKLGDLIGRSSGYIESLPAPVKRRLGALNVLQEEHTVLEKECRREMMELERKYEKLYVPLYEKRALIVDGTVEPTDAECGPLPGGASVEEVDGQTSTPSVIPATAKGIPEFWLTALKNYPAFTDVITEKDEEALRHLTNIKSTNLSDGQAGFVLEFTFAPENPYFTNTVLRKSYHLVDEGDYELMYDHAEGTKIEWKPGMDLSFKVEVKKQRHKGTQKVRTVKKTVPVPTFFSFFSPPAAPHKHGESCAHDEEHDDEDEEEDEDEQELGDILEADYNLGESIKEKIIPCAVDWFTGKALEYEDDDEFYDDEDESDEFGGEEDEDDDEEDDDEGAPGAAAGAEQPAECKQQ